MQLRTVLAVVAVLTGGLCAAPVAGAAGSAPGSEAVVAPAHGGGMTGGQLLGEAWATANFTGAPNPLNGNCGSLARDVIVAHFDDDLSARCQGTQRTRLFLFFGTACFAKLDGAGETEQEQLACAIEADHAIHELNVTVDGETTSIVSRRFELFSPQRTVQLPEEIFGVPEDSFTAHAWGAVVRRLRPGLHTVSMELVAPEFGGTAIFTVFLTVVRDGAR